jgi:hypothetical protein
VRLTAAARLPDNPAARARQEVATASASFFGPGTPETRGDGGAWRLFRHHGGMQEPTSAHLIVAALRRGETEFGDDELAVATGINRHYVNAVCRRLATDGVIVRERGPSGNLVNRLVGPARSSAAVEKLTASSGRSRSRSRNRDLRDERIAELIADSQVSSRRSRRAKPFLARASTSTTGL